MEFCNIVKLVEFRRSFLEVWICISKVCCLQLLTRDGQFPEFACSILDSRRILLHFVEGSKSDRDPVWPCFRAALGLSDGRQVLQRQCTCNALKTCSFLLVKSFFRI